MKYKKLSLAVGAVIFCGFLGHGYAQVAVAGGQLNFPHSDSETQAIYKQGNGNYVVYSESQAYKAEVSNKGFPAPKAIIRKEIDNRTGVAVVHLEPGQSFSIIYGSEQRQLKRAGVRSKSVSEVPVSTVEVSGENSVHGVSRNIRTLE